MKLLSVEIILRIAESLKIDEIEVERICMRCYLIGFSLSFS
jgi:hypothetical protein